MTAVIGAAGKGDARDVALRALFKRFCGPGPSMLITGGEPGVTRAPRPAVPRRPLVRRGARLPGPP